jgi:hypothetical protein
MIIIAGDSWGCGELEVTDNTGPDLKYGTVTHTGLEQYLQDDGYNVINLSVGGSSNTDIWNQLNNSLNTLNCVGKVSDVDGIFVFQTEWHRCYRRTLPLDSVIDIDYIRRIMSAYYYRLSGLALKYNVRIGLIGGCSDVLWLDAFEKEYPGVFIACQSMINLCLNDNHRTENPLFDLLPDLSIIDKMKSNNFKNTEFLLTQLTDTSERTYNMSQCPQFFAPDFVHANQFGHQKLYNLLKLQKMLS